MLRVQVGKSECDYAQHTEAMHGEVVRALTDELSEKAAALTKLKGAEKRYERLVGELKAQHEEKLLSLTSELEQRDVRLVEAAEAAERKLANVVGTKMRMIQSRDEKLALADSRLVELRTEFAEERAQLQSVNEERLSTIRQACGRMGGRPVKQRTDTDLEDLLGATASAARQAMAVRIGDVIGVVGEESEISLQAIVDALIEGGYLELLWETEEIWRMRMDWVEEKREDLSLAWSAEFAMRVRDKLVISYDKMDELRYMLSHHRVGKQLRPRTWIVNPWTGSQITFPQPIRPRSGALGWARLVAAAQLRYGLTMDKSGRIAQRSYMATVGLQYQRDHARGLLRPVTENEPLVSVLGADGTGIGKRSMMHVACSIAPSYRDGISVENEKNVNTVATSVTNDHWHGLNETLCGGCFTGDCDVLPPTSIAAEVNAVIRTKQLPVASADGDTPTSVPAKVRGCFDLVAARGIRGGRGRCACHTEATTAQRFDVPPITETTTWAEAKVMLDKHPMLLASNLRADSHTPPADWDYKLYGPWMCKRRGCGVKFDSDAAFRAARVAFLAVKADKSSDGKKATAARAKKYAELHPSEQGEFEPPLTDLDMQDILLDPLHCLMLNIPKVGWKYTFGDRMTNEQRELVAEYLTSIGCPLDVRAKGDGRDANRKWFSGETFQRFVEGDAAGLSPGLAENIKAIMDIIYLKAPAPAPPPGDAWILGYFSDTSLALYSGYAYLHLLVSSIRILYADT